MDTTMGLRDVVGLLVAGVLMAVTAAGWAHQTEESEHHAEVDAQQGEVDQLLSISAADLAHHLGHLAHGEDATPELLREIRGEMSDYIDEQTGVRTDETDCSLVEAEFVEYPGEDGRVHRRQVWECPERPDKVEFANQMMLDHHGDYRHVGNIQVGEQTYHTVFDRSYPTYSVYPQPADPQQQDEPEAQSDESDERGPDEEPADAAAPEDEPDSEGAFSLLGAELAVLGAVGVVVVVILMVLAVRRGKS